MFLRLLKTFHCAALPLASSLLKGLQSNAPAMTLLSLQALAASSIFWAAAALAGPPVTITFKNRNAAADARYQVSGGNEASTYANAGPKPVATVPKSGSDVYVVTSLINPDVNFANVRYQIGSRQCVFGTSFVNALKPGGYKVPQWNKTAKGSGGAVCTATITSTNLASHAWSVDFVMQ